MFVLKFLSNETKISGENSAAVKAVNADAIWRFSSKTTFPCGLHPKISIKIHFEKLIHVTCVEMMQKIFHQNHFAD